MAIRILFLVTLGLFVTLNLSACSIAMALHGAPEPDFDHIKIGSTREQVDFDFHHTGEAAAIGDGKTEVTYKYEMGNTSNPARASIYGLYDLLYIGIPEPIFTLIELFQGHDEETRVVFGPDNRALEILGYTPPPPSEALKAAREEQEKFVRKRPADQSSRPVESAPAIQSLQETATP